MSIVNELTDEIAKVSRAANVALSSGNNELWRELCRGELKLIDKRQRIIKAMKGETA